MANTFLWQTPQHQPPDENKKTMQKEQERQEMPLISEGVVMGEGSLRADMSWHVPSFTSSLLSLLPLQLSSSFLCSLPHSLLNFVSLFMSLAPSSLLSSSLGVTALPSLSCLPIICDQCCVQAHQLCLPTDDNVCVRTCISILFDTVSTPDFFLKCSKYRHASGKLNK